MTLSLCLLLALGSGPQSPGPMDLAQQEAQEQRWDRALSLAEQALSSGVSSQPLQTAEIYGFIGKAAAVIGDDNAAQLAFARALELRPDFELSLRESPRILQPFRAARQSLSGAHLTLEARAERSWDGEVEATVGVHGDALSLVDRVRLESPERDETAGTQLSPPNESLFFHWRCATVPCRFWVTLLDARGNTLALAGTPSLPLEAAQQRPATRAPTPWFQGPVLWVVGAASFAIVSGIFLVGFKHDPGHACEPGRLPPKGRSTLTKVFRRSIQNGWRTRGDFGAPSPRLAQAASLRHGAGKLVVRSSIQELAWLPRT